MNLKRHFNDSVCFILVEVSHLVHQSEIVVLEQTFEKRDIYEKKSQWSLEMDIEYFNINFCHMNITWPLEHSNTYMFILKWGNMAYDRHFKTAYVMFSCYHRIQHMQSCLISFISFYPVQHLIWTAQNVTVLIPHVDPFSWCHLEMSICHKVKSKSGKSLY